jgi:hypothetical protein
MLGVGRTNGHVGIDPRKYSHGFGGPDQPG